MTTQTKGEDGVTEAALLELRRHLFDEAEADADARGLTRESDAWHKFMDEAAQRITSWKDTAARVQREWERAGPPSIEHGYLQRKRIVSVEGLAIRQYKDRLIIPMKSLLKGAPLLSVQRILPDGAKRFAKGGRSTRVRTTIGAEAFRKDGIMFVCEGWATGWAIHHATQEAVVVAFSSGNLEPVAVAMRERYPLARIIVASDNDRWTKREGKPWNPGVEYGRKAAKAAQAMFALPDFDVLEGHPTDYNDLYVLQGPDAVREWLDPGLASVASTEPAPDPPAPSPVPVAAPPAPSVNGNGAHPPEPEPDDPPEARTWEDRAPFRCLGYDRGVYYYLGKGTGQIMELTTVQHDRKPLLALAAASWWEREFPAKTWTAAADALFRASHRSGVFRPGLLRGRGAWRERADGGRSVLLHLGDRLLPPGSRSFLDPEQYVSPERHIYERQQALEGPSSERAMGPDDARKILDLFQDLLWVDEASGGLLAGWAVLAPVCGALPWRPHAWLTGGSGAGKTTVLNSLVFPLLGGMGVFYEGVTTEAGIRHELRADALPVLFDEADKEDDASDTRIQAVLALARSASSVASGKVAKGTASGGSRSYSVRSMFLLSSIGGSVRQEADKTRIAMLQLVGRGGVADDVRRDHWGTYRPRLSWIREDVGRELVARTLKWIRDGRLDATLDVMRAQAAVALGDQRAGDQYGTLLSGTWTLMAEEPPSAEEALALVKDHGLGQYLSEQAPEGLKVLRTILQQEARIDTQHGPRTVVVGDLVDECTSQVSSIQDDADRWLRAHGLRVEQRAGQHVLMLANSADWISSALRGTPYRDSWTMQLRGLPGVDVGSPKRFHAGLRSRTTVVPLSVFDNSVGEP